MTNTFKRSWCDQEITIVCRTTQEGRICSVQDSHRLAEMLQTHKNHLTRSYFLGGEIVNFPWEKTEQFCKIIWQITWGNDKPPEAQTFELESIFQKYIKAVSMAVNTSNHITQICAEKTSHDIILNFILLSKRCKAVRIPAWQTRSSRTDLNGNLSG